jgi:hypothetical protein
MTRAEAIAILIEYAGRWAENMEEGFLRRIEAGDDDAVLAEKAGDEIEEAREVRDVWRAIEVLQEGE